MLMKCKLLIFNINFHKLNTNYSGILFLEIHESLMEIRVEEKKLKFVCGMNECLCNVSY